MKKITKLEIIILICIYLFGLYIWTLPFQDQSIPYGERSTEAPTISNNPGALKWSINMETCTEYWIKIHRGCGICMSVCPYDKVNSWPHRTVQWLTEHAPWLDPLFVRGDELLGYGKVRDSKNFWDEWKPEPYGHTGG